MDPRKYIYALIGILPNVLSAPARYIADRIFSVFDDGVEFAIWLKSGFNYLWQRGTWALFYIRSFAAEAVTTIQWLIITRIPQLISSAASALRSWATNVINTVKTELRTLISTLDRWAKAAVSAVTNTLHAVRDWLLSKINAIVDRIHKTIDVWYERLTNPSKMAEWLFAALVGPFWRYIYANRDKIARWFIRSSPAFTEWLARELDAILRRIL